MIKILHTSDWHLGKFLCDKSLIEDQKYFIEEIFYKIIDDEKPDAVMIAGDIFDRAIATTESISLFNNLILTFANKIKIPLIMISGNHDSRQRMAVAVELFNKNGIYIANSIDNIKTPITIKKNNDIVNIYTLPYLDIAEVKSIIKLDKLNSISQAYSLLIKQLDLNLNQNAFNILLSHCYVNGSANTDSNNSIEIANSEEINDSTFKQFDYLALGHIHSEQKAGKIGRYSGSPICYSFDEKKLSKSISIIEINGKNYNTRTCPINPLHKMKILKGNFKELVEQGKNNPSNDYISIKLTDPNPIYMPIEQLRVYFPNIITLSSEWIKSKSIDDKNNNNFKDQIVNSTANKIQVFCKFFKDMLSETAKQEDILAFEEILQFMKREENI